MHPQRYIQVGFVFMVVGILLSLTIVGMIIGGPMLAIGLCMFLWGVRKRQIAPA
jgi:hypothetical protein